MMKNMFEDDRPQLKIDSRKDEQATTTSSSNDNNGGSAASTSGNNKPKRNRTTNSEKQFPGKLHDMMIYVEENSLESTISWINDGKGIKIHDPQALVSVLSKFFGQTKYRSFRRQLNMWHFQRISTGPNKGGLMHPFFIKNQRHLCAYMSRHIDPNDFQPSPISLTSGGSGGNNTTSLLPLQGGVGAHPPTTTTRTMMPMMMSERNSSSSLSSSVCEEQTTSATTSTTAAAATVLPLVVQQAAPSSSSIPPLQLQLQHQQRQQHITTILPLQRNEGSITNTTESFVAKKKVEAAPVPSFSANDGPATAALALEEINNLGNGSNNNNNWGKFFASSTFDLEDMKELPFLDDDDVDEDDLLKSLESGGANKYNNKSQAYQKQILQGSTASLPILGEYQRNQSREAEIRRHQLQHSSSLPILGGVNHISSFVMKKPPTAQQQHLQVLRPQHHHHSPATTSSASATATNKNVDHHFYDQLGRDMTTFMAKSSSNASLSSSSLNNNKNGGGTGPTTSNNINAPVPAVAFASLAAAAAVPLHPPPPPALEPSTTITTGNGGNILLPDMQMNIADDDHDFVDPASPEMIESLFDDFP